MTHTDPLDIPMLSLSDAPATVGVISDTHGWLDPVAADAFAEASVALIVHGGDVGDRGVLDALEQVAPLVVVRGNIDGGDLSDLPLEAGAEIGGARLVARHIAGPPRRPNKATRALLARTRPDVLIVGHSHIPTVARVSGALWINPGAAGHQGFHTQRFAALLHLAPGTPPRLDRMMLGVRGRAR